MKSIQKQIKTEIVINKSHFINYTLPIKDVIEANQVLDTLKEQYKDANHHCYAYILGHNQNIQKYSDDGEPSKTAGIPLLDVLQKNNLTNVITVTIRYFGGIKLGAGGLVRAYSKSCANSILEAKFTHLTELSLLELIIPFDQIGHVEKFIREDYDLKTTNYDTHVHYQIELETNQVEACKQFFLEQTNGNIEFITLKEYNTYR
jgi:uncharacterized YigZ family protein